MKTIWNVTVILCQLMLLQNAAAQNDLVKLDSANTQKLVCDIKPDPLLSYQSCTALDFEAEVFLLESEEMREAYDYLLAKVEKLKIEKKLYQKAIQQYAVVPSEKAFSCQNIPNTTVRCGDAFIEPMVPLFYNEKAVITYFVPEDHKEARLCISDLNGKLIWEHEIQASGYGQVTVPQGTLETGSYDYCLLVDHRKMDCMKMILMKQ